MRMKNENGVTLVILVMTVMVMLILLSVTVGVSNERMNLAKINSLYSEIELLNDKVELYYLEKGDLPVVQENDNQNKTIEISGKIDNDVINTNDNGAKYYVIDLEKVELKDASYGLEYEKWKNSSDSDGIDDIYIINEKTHTIYYYAGIEYKGKTYYRKAESEEIVEDNIPPSKPEIVVTSGESTTEESGETVYTTAVSLTVTPGQDNWSGVSETTYKVDSETENKLPEDNIIKLTENGQHTVTVCTYDKEENKSECSITVKIKLTETT